MGRLPCLLIGLSWALLAYAFESKFKPGAEVLDRDGEPCRVLTVDAEDPEKPYELGYPNGESFWAAESEISLRPVTSAQPSKISKPHAAPPPDSNAAADEKEFQRQELLRIAAAKQSADAIDASATYALTTGEAPGEVHGAWLPEGLSFVVSATVVGVEHAAIGFETKNGGQHLLTLEMVSGHWSWLPETGWFTKSRNTEWLPATQVSRIKARFDRRRGRPQVWHCDRGWQRIPI